MSVDVPQIQELLEELTEGSWGNIYCLKGAFIQSVCRQSLPAAPFIEELEGNEFDDFAGIVQHLADNGRCGKKNLFNHEFESVWAVKINGNQNQMYRFPCFRCGDNWILMFVFTKERKKKWNEKHVDWSLQIYEAFQQRLSNVPKK